MKEFMIGFALGWLLMGYGAYLYFVQHQSSGVLFAIAGVAIGFGANYVSGKFFKQQVPQWVIQRIFTLVQDPTNKVEDFIIVPFFDSKEQPASYKTQAEVINTLTWSVMAYRLRFPNLGLAFSEKHQVIFVNPDAVRAILKRTAARTIVNEWYSFRGAVRSAGFSLLDLDK
jgi:hypothetical protein